MSELILHHYDVSPYAEKIRLALGYKSLPWRSVQIPMVMPKPDLVELTGGYRRTPTLQIGADIYCDTKVIARVLDRVAPMPPLVPPGEEAVVHGVSRWAETSFMMVVIVLFGENFFDESFVEDRRSMVPPGADLSKMGVIAPTKLVQLRANLDFLERQLGDGRPYLLGEHPTLADLSAYHPVMFLGAHPKLAALIEPLSRVRHWMGRVTAIGYAKREELSSSEALEIARDATPARFEGEPVLPEGFSLGDPVVVLPDEFGSGNVAGALAPSGLHEIAVRRRGERVGDVVVHFPREDYTLVRT